MSGTAEHRTAAPVALETTSARPGGIRAGAGTGRFEAIAVRYNVIDDYNTSFVPGCFTEGLQKRLPRICWSHSWAEPIGRVISYTDSATELRIIAQLDLDDAVPTAQRAWAQLKSGTIVDVSVGFARLADQPDPDNKGVTRITRATLDEVSLVLVGAVPGAVVVGTRARGAVRESSAGLAAINGAVARLVGRGLAPDGHCRALEQADAALAWLERRGVAADVTGRGQRARSIRQTSEALERVFAEIDRASAGTEYLAAAVAADILVRLAEGKFG